MFVPTVAFLQAVLAGTSAPPPPPPAVLLLDLFVDANNTHLEDHVMDVGGGWTQTPDQDYRIFSNAANDQFGSDGACLADAGVAVGSVSVALSTGANTIYGGLAFNGLLGGDSWSMLLDSVGSMVWILDPGLVPAASAGMVIAADMTYRLRVLASGDRVQGFVNDVEVLDVTVTDRPQKDDTGFGLYGLAGSSGDLSTYHAFMFLG